MEAGQNVSFAFSFLELLKEMKTWSQSKISSCRFGIRRIKRELGDLEN